jgi:hypothetical protein
MANIEGLEPVLDPFVSKSKRERESYFARFAPEIGATSSAQVDGYRWISYCRGNGRHHFQ